MVLSKVCTIAKSCLIVGLHSSCSLCIPYEMIGQDSVFIWAFLVICAVFFLPPEVLLLKIASSKRDCNFKDRVTKTRKSASERFNHAGYFIKNIATLKNDCSKIIKSCLKVFRCCHNIRSIILPIICCHYMKKEESPFAIPKIINWQSDTSLKPVEGRRKI